MGRSGIKVPRASSIEHYRGKEACGWPIPHLVHGVHLKTEAHKTPDRLEVPAEHCGKHRSRADVLYQLLILEAPGAAEAGKNVFPRPLDIRILARQVLGVPLHRSHSDSLCPAPSDQHVATLQRSEIIWFEEAEGRTESWVTLAFRPPECHPKERTGGSPSCPLWRRSSARLPANYWRGGGGQSWGAWARAGSSSPPGGTAPALQARARSQDNSRASSHVPPRARSPRLPR